MTRDSGGGGSNKSTRALPKGTPVGYQGVGGNTQQQVDNIDGAFDRQAKERRETIDAQVRDADQLAFEHRMGRPQAGARASASVSGAVHDEVTDGLADAIIGAIFITHVIARTANKVMHPGTKDQSPRSDEVFRLDPAAKPAPVQRDARSQEARRAKQQQQWRQGMADKLDATTKYGTSEDPGWTN